MSPILKKPWHTPRLRTEEVQETLARPACNFKPPGQGGPRPPQGPPPHGPAFS
jgi:hypothetical protein